MSNSTKPIIVVTGANGGIGFGICQRLLFQFCHANPTDALPQSFAVNRDSSDTPNRYDGLTLIMACRSAKRAEVARAKLIRLLDTYIAKLGKQPGYDGHAGEFRRNVAIDILPIDLAELSSVFKFADEVSLKYPYISHIICNAGLASFTGIHWPTCLKQLFTEPMNAITAPAYYLQRKGETSTDGLGWVWQCNLFGHYVLFRSTQHLLTASPPSLGARVIWMSSLEASPTFYNPDDWQLKHTEHSYESTKYQIDLIGTHLDIRALNAPGPQRIRHFVTEPGVCSTNVSHALAGPMLDILKVIIFYIGRLCGSPHHSIDPYKAAIGAVHLSLASLAFITLWPKPSGKKDASIAQPVKFGAKTDRWGNERVGFMKIKDWEKQKDQGEALLEKCEALFQSFKNTGEATVNLDIAE